MKRIDITTSAWDQYELIDTGDGRKLERFNTVIVDRPDPQALWVKINPQTWVQTQAQFLWAEKSERWKVEKDTPKNWTISWEDMNLNLSFNSFKHIGIFPEHREQWKELQQLGHKHQGLRMINLFGYTGAASIAAAQAGMKVTHVDASKQTVQIVRDNITLSGLPTDSVRTVVEDTFKYVKRLISRDEQFEVIVMDPPAFGRGPKGEVWKIEESLAELLSLLPQLLSPDAKLVILNGYASGYSARTFAELLETVVPNGVVSYGDVGILQSNSTRVLSTGIYAKWALR